MSATDTDSPKDAPANSSHWLARFGVRTYLFLALVTTAVAPVALFAWNRTAHLATIEFEAADRQTVATARAATQQILLALQGYTRAAETLSAQTASSELLDPIALVEALYNHLTHHPEFLGAYVADARGLSLASVAPDGELLGVPVDYSDRDYFRELLRTRRTTISRAAVGRVTQVLSVQLVAPVLDPNLRLMGFTCSSLDLSAITETAKRTADGLTEGRVIILDNYGTLIGDSSTSQVLKPTSKSTVSLYAAPHGSEPELRVGLDDHLQLVRSAVLRLPAPLEGWSVVAAVPQARVHEQVQRMRYAALKFGAAFCALAVLLSAWLATTIARPLRSLAEAARVVTQGDLSVPFSLPRKAPRELHHLGLALRTMLGALRLHAERLEGLVAERTSELQDKNAELVDAMGLLHEKERRLRSDVEQAKLFQQALLPKEVDYAGLDIATHFAPLEQVSGDIFDVCATGPDTVRLFLADATGHGVQASMRTILLKATYDRLKLQHATPNDLLAALNASLLSESIGSELHCTACCVDIHRFAEGASVTLACAGAPPLYVLTVNELAREIYAKGPLMGVMETTMPEPIQFQLACGQVLLVTSDGLLEQWDPSRNRFEHELGRFRAAENQNAKATLLELLERFETFRAGTSVDDDITAIAVRIVARNTPSGTSAAP